MKILFIKILFLAYTFCNAQSFGSRSSYEKKWAFFHPFAALKVRSIYKKTMLLYNETKSSNKLDLFENGGKLDAYRHVFFMAAFTQKIKPKKIKKLGDAHEKGNYRHFINSIKEHGEIPDSLSTVMDLYNNTIGIEIGRSNKKLKPEDLNNLVIKEINAGKALYFKRDHNGNLLNCKGEIVDLKLFVNKWAIPKCLVPTDN